MKNNRPFFPGRHQASAGEKLNAVWLRYQFLLRRFKLLERLDF